MPFLKGHQFYKGAEKGWFKKGQKPFNKQDYKKSCSICKKQFNVIKSLLKKKRFCSKKCYTKFQKINPNKGTFRIGHNVSKEWITSWSIKNKKQKNRNIEGLKLGHQRGKKHHLWKGDKIGYYPLHRWIAYNLGRPKKCEMCGSENEKEYDWANKDHKYKRDFKDWIRLCKPCHRKYDYARSF